MGPRQYQFMLAFKRIEHRLRLNQFAFSGMRLEISQSHGQVLGAHIGRTGLELVCKLCRRRSITVHEGLPDRVHRLVGRLQIDIQDLACQPVAA